MADKSENIPVSFTIGIRENKILHFSLTDYAKRNKKQVDFDKYEFIFTLNTQLLEVDKLLSITIDCTLFEVKENAIKTELAKLIGRSVFSIVNLEKIAKKEKGSAQILIPDQLLILCNSITISTVRGMFSVKLDDTIYSNAILPIVDAKKLLPQSINR